jgi:hypothetical protein
LHESFWLLFLNFFCPDVCLFLKKLLESLHCIWLDFCLYLMRPWKVIFVGAFKWQYFCFMNRCLGLAHHLLLRQAKSTSICWAFTKLINRSWGKKLVFTGCFRKVEFLYFDLASHWLSIDKKSLWGFLFGFGNKEILELVEW